MQKFRCTFTVTIRTAETVSANELAKYMCEHELEELIHEICGQLGCVSELSVIEAKE